MDKHFVLCSPTLENLNYPFKKSEAQGGHKVNWFPIHHQLINGSIWIGLGWVGALEQGCKKVMSEKRSSPQAPGKVRGSTSSAGGRCSSDTVQFHTVRTQERRGDINSCFSVLTHWFMLTTNESRSTLSSLKAVIQQVLLCSSSAHSIFSSLQSLLTLLGCQPNTRHSGTVN